MTPEITLRRVAKDEDRARVRDFFATHIPDPTALRVPPRQFDTQLGIPSRIRVAEDADGVLVGAAFASNNPEDVIGWRARGENEVADVIANEMLVIHDLAVSPAARRAGIGTQLAHAAIDDGRASNASIVALIYNQRSIGLASFYEKLGFTSLKPAQRLALTFEALPGTTVGFPQSDPQACWAVLPLSSRRVHVVTS